MCAGLGSDVDARGFVVLRVHFNTVSALASDQEARVYGLSARVVRPTIEGIVDIRTNAFGGVLVPLVILTHAYENDRAFLLPAPLIVPRRVDVNVNLIDAHREVLGEVFFHMTYHRTKS